MNIAQGKQLFIDFLYSRGVYKRRVTNDLYLTRCPYCGDSRTTLNTGHLYIRVDPDNDNRMVFYCQKCQEHGVVGNELIALLDGDDELLSAINVINRYGVASKRYDEGREFIYFDYQLSNIVGPAYRRKITYIENRLGINITTDKMEELKIVPSAYDFLIKNDIKGTSFNKRTMNLLERDYVGFLSTGNSHILFRDVTDSHEYPWLKYPITKESRRNLVTFSYSGGVDVSSMEPLVINLSEGVFDTIGIREHFHSGSQRKTRDMAVCSQNYYGVVKYLVSVGVFGANTELNLYFDNDKDFNNGKETKISNYMLKVCKSLFGRVNAYRNLIGKDYGVKKEKILLDKRTL